MPSNVEIKARVADVERLKRLAGELCDEGPTVIKQVDTFFHVPNGRLKLRQLQEEKSQLIFYDRDDQAGPKCSEFFTHHTDNPDSLQVVLSKALGVKGEVRKSRLLYMVGQTRVHVDNVEGLGDFMELEVLLKDGQGVEEGQAIANDLMKKLDIRTEDLISGAYMDLILNKAK